MADAQVVEITDATQIQPMAPDSGKFTGEYARLMSQKAALARKQKQEEIRGKLNFLTGAETSVAAPGEDASFRIARLARVREQLVKLDAQMALETDPQKQDRIASAQAKLSIQERELAGRPLPGALRPTSRRSRNQAGGFAPTE